MKKVAIVGIQGVPAKYGGFETLVENIIGENCSSNIQYTIFCSSKDYETKTDNYKGAEIRYVPFFHANGIQSTPYDILSMIMCILRFDTVVVLGVSGCMFLPVFRMFFRKKLIVNIDGLEHRRAKWGSFAKWFLRTSEAMAVRFANVIIADNKGIEDYVTERYHKRAELIAYGGDHVMRDVTEEKQSVILESLILKKNGFAVSVCRIEPENNCHITLEAFAKSDMDLVFIGNWKHSCYGLELKKRYEGYRNIHMIDSVYDLDILFTLRKNARMYIHGHSAGGTNPSLVEAMFFGRPILAYDVVYNRATTFNKAYYFKNSDDLISLIVQPCLKGEEMRQYAETHYKWKLIAKQYEQLY